MAKSTIIERIAAKQRKKKRRRAKAKLRKKSKKDFDIDDLERLKAMLESRLKSEQKKSAVDSQVSDQRLLDAIKKEIEVGRAKPGSEAKDKLPDKELAGLVENGNKEDWSVFLVHNLKARIKIELPALDPEKCKFDDYGYRQLIELIIESENLLRIITEVKNVSGFQMVEMNSLIRGDDATLRGLEALCGLLINTEIRYDPVCETDFKYLNIILDAIAMPKLDGINRVWEIKTESKELTISAAFDKGERMWIYSVTTQKTQP